MTIPELQHLGPGLRAAGWSYRAIGERFGVSGTTVAKYLDAGFRERQKLSKERWRRAHPARDAASHNRARRAK